MKLTLFSNLANKKTAIALTVLAVFLLLIDRFLKILAINYFSNHSLAIFPWFKFFYVPNYNISFSLPLSGPILTITIFGLILLLSTIFYKLLKKQNFNQAFLILFIILGASSNLFDRLSFGHVIDYLYLQSLFVFNLADAMICLATISLIVLEIKKDHLIKTN